jgi:RNA polymerase sigma-70 factor, ECF subfamily
MPTSNSNGAGPGTRDAAPPAEVILRARAGDPAATEDLIRAYQRRIAGFVISHTGERDDYEDLCQKIFVKMVLALPRLNSTDTFEAWLFTIARNVCTDHLRARRGWRSLFVHFEDEYESVAAPQAPAAGVDSDAVNHALARMPQDQRELLTLAIAEDRSYEDMARISNISLAALKSRLFRARKALREILTEGESST